ncbi:hypothetical protein [Streptomyces sp. AK02-04a]|uniref:hypothetical protein n=1 Tax=Streptomyces sp. AK02-04a TaxID=3028649 RepID=UPI0029CA60DA|nr:hypothetical protein [Streptomyces sp. AK02-04a]
MITSGPGVPLVPVAVAGPAETGEHPHGGLRLPRSYEGGRREDDDTAGQDAQTPRSLPTVLRHGCSTGVVAMT